MTDIICGLRVVPFSIQERKLYSSVFWLPLKLQNPPNIKGIPPNRNNVCPPDIINIIDESIMLTNPNIRKYFKIRIKSPCLKNIMCKI